MCHLYRLRINTHVLTFTMPCFIARQPILSNFQPVTDTILINCKTKWLQCSLLCRTFHSAWNHIQIPVPTSQHRNGVGKMIRIGILICEWNRPLACSLMNSCPVDFNTVRNVGKVMFSQACVKNSVHRGVCLSACWDTHPPWSDPGGVSIRGGVCIPASVYTEADTLIGRHPPGQTSLLGRHPRAATAADGTHPT